MILICKMDNSDAVDKYTDSGYKNNVILFRNKSQLELKKTA